MRRFLAQVVHEAGGAKQADLSAPARLTQAGPLHAG